MEQQNAQTIGRFEPVKKLGSGSQGTVYLARDPRLDRFVALKLVTTACGELAETAANGMPQEAIIASQLNHPNIIPIYDAGTADPGPFLIFEYVEGRTLAQALEADGAWSIEDAVPVMAALLAALESAHAAGVVHLDLSPRNVQLGDDGVPRIMDFGLSQFVEAAGDRSGATKGTLRYMAPEHFRGLPLGPWTDVFAMGSTLFEMVTGLRAMQGSKLEDIRKTILAADVDLSILNDMPHGVPFARFLAGAFETSREGRYSHGGAMREAFDLFLDESGLEPHTGSSSPHSTIDFLLRRMQRKQDFPAVSRTLADINRLTGEDSDTSADKLANVILRDLALTSKLLKLVNSAFYGSRTTEITSVSQAVVFLGLDQVRMTANSLTLFGALQSDSSDLKESMTRSFLSGLIARHLAGRAGLRDAELAFICGMCQNLGENLVIYYFPEEFGEIEKLRLDNGLGKSAASRGILDVSYAELGAAVAKTWGLPASIVDAIRGMPPGKVRAPNDEDHHMRDISVFANRLCDAFRQQDIDDVDATVRRLCANFEASVDLDDETCLKLVNAGLEKLKQYAPIFEIRVSGSDYCRSVHAWLTTRISEQRVAS